jgi:hypothetical protein
MAPGSSGRNIVEKRESRGVVISQGGIALLPVSLEQDKAAQASAAMVAGRIIVRNSFI